MASSVEPCVPPPELNNTELSLFQEVPINVSYFQFSTSRWAQFGSHIEHGVVVKIKSGDRPIGKELLWLFDDVCCLPHLVERHHAVLARFADIVSKYGSALFARYGN